MFIDIDEIEVKVQMLHRASIKCLEREGRVGRPWGERNTCRTRLAVGPGGDGGHASGGAGFDRALYVKVSRTS